MMHPARIRCFPDRRNSLLAARAALAVSSDAEHRLSIGPSSPRSSSSNSVRSNAIDPLELGIVHVLDARSKDVEASVARIARRRQKRRQRQFDDCPKESSNESRRTKKRRIIFLDENGAEEKTYLMKLNEALGLVSKSDIVTAPVQLGIVNNSSKHRAGLQVVTDVALAEPNAPVPRLVTPSEELDEGPSRDSKRKPADPAVVLCGRLQKTAVSKSKRNIDPIFADAVHEAVEAEEESLGTGAGTPTKIAQVSNGGWLNQECKPAKSWFSCDRDRLGQDKEANAQRSEEIGLHDASGMSSSDVFPTESTPEPAGTNEPSDVPRLVPTAHGNGAKSTGCKNTFHDEHIMKPPAITQGAIAEATVGKGDESCNEAQDKSSQPRVVSPSNGASEGLHRGARGQGQGRGQEMLSKPGLKPKSAVCALAAVGTAKNNQKRNSSTGCNCDALAGRQDATEVSPSEAMDSCSDTDETPMVVSRQAQRNTVNLGETEDSSPHSFSSGCPPRDETNQLGSTASGNSGAPVREVVIDIMSDDESSDDGSLSQVDDEPHDNSNHLIPSGAELGGKALNDDSSTDGDVCVSGAKNNAASCNLDDENCGENEPDIEYEEDPVEWQVKGIDHAEMKVGDVSEGVRQKKVGDLQSDPDVPLENRDIMASQHGKHKDCGDTLHWPVDELSPTYSPDEPKTQSSRQGNSRENDNHGEAEDGKLDIKRQDDKDQDGQERLGDERDPCRQIHDAQGVEVQAVKLQGTPLDHTTTKNNPGACDQGDKAELTEHQEPPLEQAGMDGSCVEVLVSQRAESVVAGQLAEGSEAEVTNQNQRMPVDQAAHETSSERSTNNKTHMTVNSSAESSQQNTTTDKKEAQTRPRRSPRLTRSTARALTQQNQESSGNGGNEGRVNEAVITAPASDKCDQQQQTPSGVVTDYSSDSESIKYRYKEACIAGRCERIAKDDLVKAESANCAAIISASTSNPYSLRKLKCLWRHVFHEKLDVESESEIENSSEFCRANRKVQKDDSRDQGVAQYGRILPDAMDFIFRKVMKLGPTDTFVDLGHGLGNTCMQAAYTIGCDAKGVELVDSRYFASEAINRLLAKAALERRKQIPSRWDRRAGSIELKHGRIEDPAHFEWLTEKKHFVYVNNFAEVMDSRSNPKGKKPTVDARIAAIFASMPAGSVMVTMHPISSLGSTRDEVLEHRQKHGLRTRKKSDASFFSREEIKLGKARETVSWSEGHSTDSDVVVYKYTRLKQPGNDGAVVLCTTKNCQNATNATPIDATTDSTTHGGLLMNRCGCKFSIIQTRNRRRTVATERR